MNEKIKFMGREKVIDMFCLLDKQEGISYRNLSKITNVVKNYSFKLIHLMDNAGLIAREKKGREHLIRLTEKGQKLKDLFIALEEELAENQS